MNSNISYKSSLGVFTYGLAAAIICCNIDDLANDAAIIPSATYNYSIEEPAIDAPQIQNNIYLAETAEEDTANIIYKIIQSMSKEITPIDLEMLSVIDDNIWDLF